MCSSDLMCVWPAGETHIPGMVAQIGPDASSHDVTAIVTVTATNGGPWHFLVIFAIDAPEVEFTKLDAWVDDPAPDGNADGVANAGERVRIGIRLRNDGPTDATGVTLSLSTLDPDVTPLVAEALHTDWPRGEERDTEFVLDIADAAQTRDVPVFVTAQADGAGPWQFSIVMPVVGPEPDFSLRNFWTFDPAPDGNGDGRAVSGERVFPRVRLVNSGDGDGRDVRVSLSTLDADVTVVSGEATHATWPAGAARNNEALVLDIAPDAQPHAAALVVDVVDADGSAWRFDVTMPIAAPAIEFVERNFWLFDPEPGGDRNGAANPGERVFPRVRLQNPGLDIAHDIHVALSTDDPDVTVVAGTVDHAKWAPGAARNNVGLALDIDRDAMPHDVTVQVAVTAAHGRAWEFSYTFAIAYRPVEFVLRNSWIFDPEPGGDHDGQAEAGERVLPRIRLRHVGTVAAEDVTVAIELNDPDVTVIHDQVTYATWEPGVALNSVGLALDIDRAAAAHEVAAWVVVTVEGRGLFRSRIALAIEAPAVEFVMVDFDQPPVRAGAGQDLRPSLRHIGAGSAENVRAALVVTDPDVTVKLGLRQYDAWAAGTTRETAPFRVFVDPEAVHHDIAITLVVTADGWGPWQFDFVLPMIEVVALGRVRIEAVDPPPGGNRDGRMQPGETVQFILWACNATGAPLRNLRLRLSAEDPDITVVVADVSVDLWERTRCRYLGGWSLAIADGGSSRNVTLVFTASTDHSEPVEYSGVLRVRADPPNFERRNHWVFDPAPGGNSDGAMSPGERVLPRLRLRYSGEQPVENVRATLTVTDPDVTVQTAGVTHETWVPGEARNNDGFVLDIAPDATAHDVSLALTVTADGAGPWSFTYVVPIVEPPPDIQQRSDWIWDPAPGGNLDREANPGERLQWRVRLRNAGGVAQNAQVSIVINDDDVTIVSGAVTHDTWPVGEARNHSFVLDISPTATAHDVNATVSVTADNGGPWQFDLSMPIIVPVIAETALFANFPNPFNPETWIPFDLSQAADVTVRIYDIAGRPIRRLDLGWQQPGSYRRRATAAYWDGRNEVGEAASSGVYLYALRAGGHREMRRMIVRK